MAQCERVNEQVGRRCRRSRAVWRDTARKGIFISTSQFTKEARDYVTRIEKKIVLIDGEKLNEDYFEED